MKSWLYVAGAVVLATSALIPAANADQRIPAPQMYAQPAATPAEVPPTAYPPPQSQGLWSTDSTTPAKIGSPKQP
jgi:hypothetical protein